MIIIPHVSAQIIVKNKQQPTLNLLIIRSGRVGVNRFLVDISRI